MARDIELWRPVPDFEGWYEVSSYGRIRSVGRVVEVADPRGTYQRRLKGQPLQVFPHPSGYSQVSLKRNGVTTGCLVHRLVLGAFAGPPPECMEGCHEDNDKTNNRLDNLRWDTRPGNHSDKARHGTLGAKAECHRGHAFVRRNLTPSGLRLGKHCCLACSRGAAHIRNAKRDGRPYGTIQEESDRHYQKIMAQG